MSGIGFLFLLPSLVLRIGYFTSFVKVLHEIPCVLRFKKRIHGAHDERYVDHVLARGQMIVEKMHAHAVPCLAYAVKPRWERAM